MDLREHLQATFGSTYRVDDELRGAGMSRVFVAVEEQLGRQVVIKVLPPELAATVTLERFKREIQIAAQFHHPNIVPIITAGQSGDLLYYVMPLVGSETLRGVMRRQRQLPLDDALRYARDVADALGYAHSLGIVHRDVKPENILLEGTHALLADFGIARAIERAAGLESVTSTGLAVGTPLYMSPEQAAADKRLDGRSDIYSLACVLFEMLAGHPPFQSTLSRSIIAMHLHERPPSIRTIRPDLAPEVDAAVLKALAKSPADRFATAREFIDACAVHNATPLPARRPMTRRVLVASGAAAIIGAAAIAAFVSLTSRHAGGRATDNTLDPSHIAVLPFETNGVDALAPVAAGLSRDLIVALQNVPSLSVVSPEGVQGFAHLRPDSIGRLLRVGTIVSATLERVADSLELSVRLIESSSALQRASSRIRTPASQFLRMRDSLVREVAAQLRQRLGEGIRLSEWRSQTKSDAAWTLRQTADNLLDYEATMRRTPANLAPQLSILARADSTLLAASKADPAWPDPIVERARIRIRLADYFEGAQSLAQLDTGLRIAATALARHSANAAALGTRGELRYLRVFYGAAGDGANALLDSARSDLLTATAEDNHLATAWSALSAVYRLADDLRGSVGAARQALASDAYLRSVPTATSKLILALLYSGETAEARRLCGAAQRQYPAHPELSTCELAILAYTGSTTADVKRMWELVAENERAGPWVSVNGISPIARYWAAAVIARAGMPDSAKAVTNRTRRITAESRVADDYWSIEAFARLVAADTAAAIDILGGAVDTRRATPMLIVSFPEFAALRQDPRLRARFATAR